MNIPPGEAVTIVEQSRPKNRRLDITAMLAYDGERYCELIEGAREAVETLADTIAKDPRNTQFHLLHAGTRSGARRFPSSAMAFAIFDAGSLGATLQAHPGRQLGDLLQAIPETRIDRG